MSISTAEQIKKRRTFAIISHPDAGKTTITEKLIYHGGVIRETGEVKGKAGTKAATSDWMAMEQQRGISITSSVINFDYNNLRINLLDTPGHKDFSEDTYRTLVAADTALMLIDVAKGVEDRTKKLYEVCSYRKIPIFTFINKCDREGKVPLELLDEIETTLKMKCFPVNWPLGVGDLFRGVYDRLKKRAYIYEKATDTFTTVDVSSYSDPIWKTWLHRDIYESVMEEIELVDSLGAEFDQAAFNKGEVSPAFFGSAKLNFGVDQFLEYFTQWAPPPGVRYAKDGTAIDPFANYFSAFVFKIQANMDRKHRDRIAFMRICSGEFERGMKVNHHRLSREIRLSHSNQFTAQERETVDNAYAGDIIGVSDSGNFQIGDTVSTTKRLECEDIPKFTPELFAKLSVADAMQRQKLQKGLKELSEDGAIQLFVDPVIGIQDAIIGVVGELQFEVLQYRLEDEYNLATKIQRLSFHVARWPRKDGKPCDSLKGAPTLYRDINNQPVVLVDSEWDLNWLLKENEGVVFGTPFSSGLVI
ncbi:MAG: peptide chain release factor 3 [Bdellovibrionaceae bacterium]|nr:peptide chain release factor 3 [Pseudobdellovibrionaceae bacterium]